MKLKMLSDQTPHCIYRKFHISIICYRHPIRIVIWLVFLALFLPDLIAQLHDHAGEHFNMLPLGIILLSFVIFFAGPLLATFWEYKRYPICFYKNHLLVRNSLFLSEHIKIPYRSIMKMKKTYL